MLRVAARNPAGLSDWTVPKEFSTHPKEPFGLMPSVAVTLLIQNSIIIGIISVNLVAIKIYNRYFTNDVRRKA